MDSNLEYNIRKGLKNKHPFHLVRPSGWPFLISINTLYCVLVLVMNGLKQGAITLPEETVVKKFLPFYDLFITYNLTNPFFSKLHSVLAIIVFFSLMGAWFFDVVVEGTYEGHHTKLVQKGLSYGMILFIVSEVMFFFAFFWAFFHSSLSPNIEIGNVWPPVGIVPFDPWKIPLLNTIILLTSGASVTWAHHALVAGKRVDVIDALLLTVFLGLIFTMFQGYEYSHALFSLSDTVYGSVFYLATGFHGFHVIIGTCFLFVCLLRHFNYHFTTTHHFGFEAAAWYWHFVDVVWLFLFISIYWWGS